MPSIFSNLFQTVSSRVVQCNKPSGTRESSERLLRHNISSWAIQTSYTVLISDCFSDCFHCLQSLLSSLPPDWTRSSTRPASSELSGHLWVVRGRHLGRAWSHSCSKQAAEFWVKDSGQQQKAIWHLWCTLCLDVCCWTRATLQPYVSARTWPGPRETQPRPIHAVPGPRYSPTSRLCRLSPPRLHNVWLLLDQLNYASADVRKEACFSKCQSVTSAYAPL